jgi:nucleolar protein 12
MGKLKPKAKAKAKEPKESPQSEAVPSSSGIFNTLFGDATDDRNAAVSIFSESNPFRRKPQESLGFAPAESLRSPNDVVSENRNLDGELKKKRNRGKEKNPNPNLDSYTIPEDSEAPFGAKKAKEEKPQKPNLGAESNGAFEGDKGRNPNLASGSNWPSKKDKGKKPQNPNLENEKDRKPNLGSESDGALKKDEGNGSKLGPKSDGENTILGAKKKRKRDELEREYEAKKYGVAAEEEEREKKKLVGEKRKTVDNVEDLVVSPEGYDDESKLLRTVFVGNLPLKVKKKALVKEFKQFGEVESVRIRSVPILDVSVP